HTIASDWDAPPEDGRGKRNDTRFAKGPRGEKGPRRRPPSPDQFPRRKRSRCSSCEGPGDRVKIAIFHDYLETIGGAERLVLTLARHFQADLITTSYDPALPARAGFGDVNVISLGSLHPGPPFKQIDASRKFSRARFPGYAKYVLSGNWAHYAARHHHPNLYYCHTPTRMFYDQRDAVQARLPLGRRLVASTWTTVHGTWDRRAVRSCDRIIVNRLYPEKRIELQLEIFRRLPREGLTIVGGFSKGDRAERYVASLNPPANVTMGGEVPEGTLRDLYACCRGVISTAVDEDFGM